MGKRSAFLDGILADLAYSIASKPLVHTKAPTPQGAYRVKAAVAPPSQVVRTKERRDPGIGESYAASSRLKSTDYSTARFVAGEHKGIKAEGYHATATYTQKYLQRELRK